SVLSLVDQRRATCQRRNEREVKRFYGVPRVGCHRRRRGLVSIAMGCPFAQLSPLLLLSCLVLFFQFGASFLSPKPLLASLQRGRSLTDASAGVGSSSRSRAASPPPHHGGSSRD
ncbi:unnamed protein product, partial [Ectocarpus sp. 12 AP-2014]